MNSALTHGLILVIDSDLQTATSAARLLGTEGYDCQCVSDAESARRAARQLALDLILCDVQLTTGSGIELSQQLLHDSAQRNVPVMFLSAHQRPDVVHRVHESRGAYYLRKPYDPEVLLEIVARALWIPDSPARKARPVATAPAHLTHLTRRLREQSPRFGPPEP